ncbi:MAG: hypothetical protein WC703_03975 [Candidatus Neomarinimicrobiota bacterium]
MTDFLLPAMIHTVPLLRLFPISWFDFLAGFFGINASMDDFVGRQSKRSGK